jgi:hypothetical protein
MTAKRHVAAEQRPVHRSTFTPRRRLDSMKTQVEPPFPLAKLPASSPAITQTVHTLSTPYTPARYWLPKMDKASFRKKRPSYTEWRRNPLSRNVTHIECQVTFPPPYIYGLFNDAVSISDYTLSNGGVWLYINWKESSVPTFKPHIFATPTWQSSFLTFLTLRRLTSYIYIYIYIYHVPQR